MKDGGGDLAWLHGWSNTKATYVSTYVYVRAVKDRKSRTDQQRASSVGRRRRPAVTANQLTWPPPTHGPLVFQRDVKARE